MTGFRTWSTGDTVSAADFVSYIATQVITVFSTATARDAAITSPAEGMFAYTTTTPANTLSFYDGSSWVATSLTADLTGVTAGTNIDVTNPTGPVPTVTLAIDAAVNVGSDGSGVDMTFHSGTAGDYMMWDASEEKLIIEGTNGATALDVTDGNVVVGDGTLTIGSDGAGEDVTFHSGTAGDYMQWDSSEEKLILEGTNGATVLDVTDGNVLIGDGNLTINGASPIVFEGATPDVHETTIAVTDPTADRTITLPDATGTVSLTDGIVFSGSTANGMLTFHDSATAAVESTCVMDGTTLTLSAAGGGLNLSGGLASGVATTLDDYEEGFWTCALTASGSGSITVNTGSDQGSYTKVGKVVHVQGLFTVSAISSPVGTLRVGGLPFTSTTVAEQPDMGSMMGTVVNLANAKTGIITKLHPNGTFFDMNAGGGGTAEDATLADDVDTDTYFLISGSYVASA